MRFEGFDTFVKQDINRLNQFSPDKEYHPTPLWPQKHHTCQEDKGFLLFGDILHSPEGICAGRCQCS